MFTILFQLLHPPITFLKGVCEKNPSSKGVNLVDPKLTPYHFYKKITNSFPPPIMGNTFQTISNTIRQVAEQKTSIPKLWRKKSCPLIYLNWAFEFKCESELLPTCQQFTIDILLGGPGVHSLAKQLLMDNGWFYLMQNLKCPWVQSKMKQVS